MFAKYGEDLIRGGKYGAVFNGYFEDDFDSNRFTEQFKGKCIAKVSADVFLINFNRFQEIYFLLNNFVKLKF